MATRQPRRQTRREPLRPNPTQQRIVRNIKQQVVKDTMAMRAEVNKRTKQPNFVIRGHWNVFNPLTEKMITEILQKNNVSADTPRKFTFNQIRSAIQADNRLNNASMWGNEIKKKFLNIVKQAENANLLRELNELEANNQTTAAEAGRNKFVTEIENQRAALNASVTEVNTAAAKIRANKLTQINNLSQKINKATTLQNIIVLTLELRGLSSQINSENKNLRKKIATLIKKRNPKAKKLRQQARGTKWLNHLGQGLANNSVQPNPQSRPIIKKNFLGQSTNKGISKKTKQPWENAMRAAHTWGNINFQNFQNY